MTVNLSSISTGTGQSHLPVLDICELSLMAQAYTAQFVLVGFDTERQAVIGWRAG